ncbi:non-ribosomal peptide synthetase, partial [Amycolatopsis sp. NPDC000673]
MGSGDYEDICGLLAAAAEARPGQIAVRDPDRQVTYAELATLSDRVAGWLREYGAGAERVVGVRLRPSADLVAVLWGVLKSGSAFLAIDPATPDARVRQLLERAAADVLVDDNGSAVAGWAGRTACPRDAWLAAPMAGSPERAHPLSLAYVLFTSGSAGAPKGVAVPRAALSRYTAWAVRAYRLRPGKVSVLHSSIAFDLTLTSIFPALAAGQRVLVSSGLPGLAEALRAAEPPGLVKLTPSHLRALNAQSAERSRPERVVVGGEQLYFRDLHGWNHSAVFNEYGPTEATVGCSAHEVRDWGPSGDAVSIGRPIDGAVLRVLDSRLRPVPDGVAGEIYIGGTGLARGYLQAPAATAERYVPDPESEVPGARLYRTGDIGLRRADGNLVYLRRADDEIKVRGHRIDPAEINGTLLNHPSCDEAFTFKTDDERLVTVVAAAPGGRPEAAELRAFLASMLPAHLLPDLLLPVAEIPLTVNGKIDRGALTALVTAPGNGSVPRPIGDPLERDLANLFGALLGISGVDPRADFFELGGHSLLAVQLLARIEGTFGVRIPVIALLEEVVGEDPPASAAGLAQRIRADGDARVSSV